MTVTSKGLAVVLACMVAGQSMSGRQAAGGGSQAARTNGPCRTYDTSATAVTVTGPVRTTLTYAGFYDPWANRSTLTVTYSDTRGLRYSSVQVTTYDSTEDFIAEVVRLKAPAPLSSNQPGPGVNIVPPLTRSLRTTASGTMAYTLTNSYDTQGRLKKIVNSMRSGSIITLYTAWDGSGRPTAGTLQSPASSSTLALSYNDQAGTLTTTTTTGSFVAVGTQTFDANGNPTVYVQRSNTGPDVSTTTTTSVSTATVCQGDTQVPTVPAVRGRLGGSPNGTFSGSIGGMAWAATLGVQASYTPPTLSVGGGDNRYLVAVALTVNRGPGQYTAGPIDPDTLRTMDQKMFADTFARNTVVATLFDSTTRAGWHASPTAGSGTVTVTSLSAAGASGSFTLTLEPTPGTGATGNIPISGTFNVRF